MLVDGEGETAAISCQAAGFKLIRADPRTRRRRLSGIDSSIVAAIITVIGILVATLISYLLTFRSNNIAVEVGSSAAPTVATTIPEVRGMLSKDAEPILAGYKMACAYQVSALPPDTVLDELPPAGARNRSDERL